MPEYASEPAAELFARSRAFFEQMTQWLAGAEAAGLTHGELEERAGERGRELARPLGTVFGQVTVTRMAYRAPGAPNVHPADGQLNLPEEKHSHGLRKLAAVESARGSHEDAAAAIIRATGVRIGKRQVEELARGAAAAKNKLATRLSPGEKTGRKRMAELAAVYDCQPASRTAGDIITAPGKQRPARPPRPKTTGKWLTASVTSDIAAVIAAGFDEAERRDPQHKRTWIALVDGNNTQIDAVSAEAARRGVTVTVLCDFVHVLEYCWKAAWSFFETGDPDAEDWVAARATKILEGKASQVAAGIRRRATTYGYTGSERDGADNCAAYLTAKAPYLDYATALAEGWPIATGIIEGACRHLVADRLGITGARWGLDGAEAILKLRAVIANGDFDRYWRHHLRKEHERVHHARYRESFVLAA